ncbi:hypothetical protein BGX26_011707 [Mortierella sp. AD094]|nr:hypothetical protein BGX26_011707 [Mortierella sp. AD094]
MSQHTPEAKPRPDVLIIGAGIAGLTLAILLEQINVPYHIYERASEVKPLGSAMSFTGGVFPALEQLGIYEELKRVSKAYNLIDFYDARLNKMGCYSVEEYHVASGYETLVFCRPRLHEILLKRVPKHKISFKKKVLRTEEKEGKVHIHCSDNTSYTGDILVGADGVYSGVRQSMYKHMDEKGILPKADLEDFKIDYTTIVGVASPSNPEKYPKLNERYSSFNQVIYGDGSNCYIITLPDNQISWGFGVQLSVSALKEMHPGNSEWAPEIKDTTLEQYRHFPCPIGGTMGDLFDATPKHLISKVFIEEKMFKTCYNSRSVLIGDAWHKFHPAGGQGAQHCIQDAISLANCICNMKDSSLTSINSAFREYCKQRYDRNDVKFNESAAFAKILNGQKFAERFIRILVLKLLTHWTQKSQIRKAFAYRPQIAWLPLIENRGKGPVLPQEFGSVSAASA